MPRKKQARAKVDCARDIKGYFPAGGWITSPALADHLGYEDQETVIKRYVYGENDDTEHGVPCVDAGNHFSFANNDIADWIHANATIQTRPRTKGGKRKCPGGNQPR